MFITILMLGILLTGLVLLAVGLVLLLKAKNKIAGWVVVAVGMVFTLFSIAIFTLLTITTSIQG
jgi:ABC-type proline/glycine betaine transport system permease subunit